MEIFAGTVQKGSGYARKLGFPTINIPLEDTSLSGIYAARVTIKNGEAPYMAAAFADQKRHILEAHLLDVPPKDGSVSGGNDDLSGAPVAIELVEKLRETRQFEDENTLRAAIAKDVENVRRYFSKS